MRAHKSPTPSSRLREPLRRGWFARAQGRHGHLFLPYVRTGRTTVADSETTVEQQAATAILPFSVAMPEAALDDLRSRIAATRWPNRELVDDRTQGVQLAAMEALFRCWANDYDLG